MFKKTADVLDVAYLREAEHSDRLVLPFLPNYFIFGASDKYYNVNARIYMPLTDNITQYEKIKVYSSFVDVRDEKQEHIFNSIIEKNPGFEKITGCLHKREFYFLKKIFVDEKLPIDKIVEDCIEETKNSILTTQDAYLEYLARCKK